MLDQDEMDTDLADQTVLPGPQPKVEFKDVNFSYDDQPLIQDFNLKAEQNHMVAIVGPTGAGKTTIINLLERFYDVKEATSIWMGAIPVPLRGRNCARRLP